MSLFSGLKFSVLSNLQVFMHVPRRLFAVIDRFHCSLSHASYISATKYPGFTRLHRICVHFRQIPFVKFDWLHCLDHCKTVFIKTNHQNSNQKQSNMAFMFYSMLKSVMWGPNLLRHKYTITI